MEAIQLIQDEIGQAHDNPNIDNNIVAALMHTYADHCVAQERQRIIARLHDMFDNHSKRFLTDFIIDLMTGED